jgi:hypothetical protein
MSGNTVFYTTKTKANSMRILNLKSKLRKTWLIIVIGVVATWGDAPKISRSNDIQPSLIMDPEITTCQEFAEDSNFYEITCEAFRTLCKCNADTTSCPGNLDAVNLLDTLIERSFDGAHGLTATIRVFEEGDEHLCRKMDTPGWTCKGRMRTYFGTVDDRIKICMNSTPRPFNSQKLISSFSSQVGLSHWSSSKKSSSHSRVMKIVNTYDGLRIEFAEKQNSQKLILELFNYTGQKVKSIVLSRMGNSTYKSSSMELKLSDGVYNYRILIE